MTSLAEGISVGTLVFVSGVCANADSAILAAEGEITSQAERHTGTLITMIMFFS